MSQRPSQKQRIALLKQRCNGERIQFTENAEVLLPQLKKIAGLGLAGWGIAKASPILKPLAFGLFQRSLAKRGKTNWMKVVGLLSAAFGLTRMLRHKSSDE